MKFGSSELPTRRSLLTVPDVGWRRWVCKGGERVGSHKRALPGQHGMSVGGRGLKADSVGVCKCVGMYVCMYCVCSPVLWCVGRGK